MNINSSMFRSFSSDFNFIENLSFENVDYANTVAVLRTDLSLSSDDGPITEVFPINYFRESEEELYINALYKAVKCNSGINDLLKDSDFFEDFFWNAPEDAEYSVRLINGAFCSPKEGTELFAMSIHNSGFGYKDLVNRKIDSYSRPEGRALAFGRLSIGLERSLNSLKGPNVYQSTYIGRVYEYRALLSLCKGNGSATSTFRDDDRVFLVEDLSLTGSSDLSFAFLPSISSRDESGLSPRDRSSLLFSTYADLTFPITHPLGIKMALEHKTTSFDTSVTAIMDSFQ